MTDDATAIFSYRTNEKQRFTVVGEQFKARRGRWVGAKTGLFSVSADADNNASAGAQMKAQSKQASLVVDDFQFIPRRR